jgi:hypothetical protein
MYKHGLHETYQHIIKYELIPKGMLPWAFWMPVNESGLWLILILKSKDERFIQCNVVVTHYIYIPLSLWFFQGGSMADSMDWCGQKSDSSSKAPGTSHQNHTSGSHSAGFPWPSMPPMPQVSLPVSIKTWEAFINLLITRKLCRMNDVLMNASLYI